MTRHSTYAPGVGAPPLERPAGPDALHAEILDAAQRIASVPAYHLRTIDFVRRCVSHDGAILCSGPIVRCVASADAARLATVRHQTTLVGVEGPYTDLYMANPARFAPDLRKGEAALAANGGLFIDSEIYSARERDRLPFFAEVVRPQGISSFLTAQMSFRGQVCCVLVLMRHGRCLRFGEQDCARLRALLPTFGVAYAALRTGVEEQHDRAAGALTPREAEIAGLTHRGLTTPQIALALGTSANTVRKQLVHLYDKLGMASRAELAAWFERRRDDVAWAQVELEVFRVGGKG